MKNPTRNKNSSQSYKGSSQNRDQRRADQNRSRPAWLMDSRSNDESLEKFQSSNKLRDPRADRRSPGRRYSRRGSRDTSSIRPFDGDRSDRSRGLMQEVGSPVPARRGSWRSPQGERIMLGSRRDDRGAGGVKMNRSVGGTSTEHVIDEIKGYFDTQSRN